MAELTDQEFEIISTLLQSRGPVRVAARMVLVEGQRQVDAAKSVGVLPPSLSRTIRLCRETHDFILSGYDRRQDAPSRCQDK